MRSLFVTGSGEFRSAAVVSAGAIGGGRNMLSKARANRAVWSFESSRSAGHFICGPSGKFGSRSLLARASVLVLAAGLLAGPAGAAVQEDNTDDASTAALTAGNSALFVFPAAGIDEIFTIADNVNVGDGGAVGGVTNSTGVGTLRFAGDSTATGVWNTTTNRIGVLEANGFNKTVTLVGGVSFINLARSSGPKVT